MKLKSVDYILAQIISVVFNPIDIFIGSTILLFLYNKERNPFIYTEISSILIVFFVGLLPVLILYFIELSKYRKEILLNFSLSRNDRNSIYLLGVFSFLFATILNYGRNDQIFLNLGMAFTIFFGIFYISNKYIDKASLHAGSITFSIIFLTNYINVAFSMLLFILPVIFWSRINLHRHSWLQLLLGSVIGMSVGLVTWIS